MTDGLENLRGALDEFVSTPAGRDDPPPNPHDYLHGRLSEEEERAFRQRLLDDPVLAEAVLAAAQPPTFTGDEPSPPVELDMQEAWREFQSRAPAQPGRPANFRIHLAWLAACLLIGAWGLSIRMAQPGPRVIDSLISYHVDRSTLRGEPVAATHGEDLALDIQLPNRHRGFGHYDIVFTHAGATVLALSEPGPRERIFIHLPGTILKQPGLYSVAITGERNDVKEELGRFDLSLRP